jgi:cyclic dehypoxanthinyl futalosine synthase
MGRRPDRPDEALRLYELPLDELGVLADRRRRLAKAAAYDGRGNDIVTYVIDRNINYTNICNVYCKFCAFYRVEDRSRRLCHQPVGPRSQDRGDLGPRRHPDPASGRASSEVGPRLVSRAPEPSALPFPTVNVHGFSPSEFIHFRQVFGLSLEEILQRFQAAGLGSIPGGWR